jgi:hypothetical protein
VKVHVQYSNTNSELFVDPVLDRPEAWIIARLSRSLPSHPLTRSRLLLLVFMIVLMLMLVFMLVFILVL